MLDTVRVGVSVSDSVDLGVLVRDGWAVHSKRRVDQDQVIEDMWAAVAVDPHGVPAAGGAVRVAWNPAFRWLTAEASLPLLVGYDDNAVLLAWRECGQALGVLRDVVEDVVGVELPPIGQWQIARADPVHAWPTNPKPYLAALRLARLPRTEPNTYQQSLRWVSRTNRIQARAYDKAREAGHDVDLPLRLERQVRKPKRYVVRQDNGEQVGALVGSWDAQTVAGVLRATMRDLGLDAPIPTSQGARVQLVDTHGRRRGVNVWRALLDAHESGGWDLLDVSKRTRQRYESLARKAGVRGVSLNGELPALPGPLSAR